MNGRLHDPLLRRFLNADENIQDMFNTQNYNKYGYVLNNPLMFNDPSGEFFIFGFLAGMAVKWVAGMITAAIIGAVAGLVSYSLSVWISGDKWKLGAALKSTFWGAVGGAVSFGVGSIFVNGAGAATAIAETLGKFGSAIVQGGVHAITQGVLSVFQGGNFLTGAIGGAFGSWAASGFGAVAKDFANKGVGQILFGAVAGGVGTKLTGGNFWEGVLIGGIVAGLNHAMHSGDMEPDNGYDKNGNKINDNGGDTTDYVYENGKIVSSTSVKTSYSQGGELSYSLEGYGFRHYNQGTGGALTDPSFGLMTDYVLGKAVFKGLGIVGEFGGKYISTKSAQFIIKNAKYLNKNNWIRIGEGTGKGAGHIRISFGAHQNYLNEVPKFLRPLNQWMRNNIGSSGHIDFHNWKW
ncbi:RHS repeat-associated core domain-containing protein [Chryseobacterium taklimakanense]|uniref:RHS repeat-associated core domain-containing protein n=1 Tax=Chryseobacterium taklimakanense TaxID=536441 RepID=A0A3G8WJQ7_9FLAO|nr:hypothetical protein [Chryseobacterium taklimakanense]AZI21442.1 hypothetical protein EIH08_07870 [Chryseobacterium taklimakanense]